MDYNKHGRVDLHIHTTASDGTFTPSEVISLAHELKLKAIAITDHDTLAGSKEALLLGIPASLDFLTGVEISAASPPFYAGSGSFHLLGYSIRLDDPELNHALEKLQQARKNRNPAIISRLNDLGISITLDEVRRQAGDGQLARPHIAQLLVKKGVVNGMDEAFDRFLGTDGPAYVDKYRIECHQAIKRILDAGGIPVLAHPATLKCTSDEEIEKQVKKLLDYGLKGIEAFYSDHAPSQSELYLRLAEKYDLLVTGGSDFHGPKIKGIDLGTGKGKLQVPYELLQKMKESQRQ